MECTCCGAELVWSDYWMRCGVKEGDIYTCPNCEGFESKEDAKRFVMDTLGYKSLEEYLAKEGLEYWEDISCHSSMHSVCGSYYTDSSGELYEGYPC